MELKVERPAGLKALDLGVQPVAIQDEVVDWKVHPPEALQHVRDHLEELERLGNAAIP